MSKLGFKWEFFGLKSQCSTHWSIHANLKDTIHSENLLMIISDILSETVYQNKFHVMELQVNVGYIITVH